MNVHTTALQKNELLLKNCRERARLFIDGSPDPVCVHDLQGQILDANRAAIRTLGLTLNQLKTHNLYELFSDLDSSTLSARWKQLKSGDSNIVTGQLRLQRRPTAFVEIHSQRSSLRRRPVLVSVLHIGHPNQQLVTGATNKSAERELTKALKQSEDRFRMLVEQSPDAFYLHDLNGVILDVNPQSCASLGYSRDELLQLNVGDIEPQHPIDELRQIWRTMQPGVAHTFSGQNRRKDGSIFPVEVNNRRFNEGSRSLMLALIRDTTDSERLSQLLQLILHSTARWTGQDFLELLVQELAEALGMYCGFISEVTDPSGTRVRIVAAWIDGRLMESFEYDLAGTPCAQVFETGYSLIESGVHSQFPDDIWLRENAVEGYLAIPFYNAAGHPLGHIGIVDKAPLRSSHFQENVLRLFACRAGAEIERQHMQDALNLRDQQLETLLEANQKLNARLDVAEIMRVLVLAAMKLSRAASGAWGLFRNNQMIFREYYREDQVIPIDFRFDPGIGVPGHVINTLEPYITNDAGNDSHVLQDIHAELDFISLANVPILDRSGNLIGCFEVHNKAGITGFDSLDVQWLQSLAADAAIALENARLFEQIRAQHEILEHRIEERTTELAAANIDLEAFSYTVSHDLQAPLRNILGFSEVLIQDHAGQLDEKGMNHLQRIINASTRMTGMIQSLLELSRMSHAPLSATQVNLSRLAQEILDELRDQDSDRRLEAHIAVDISVRGDRHLLHIALTNLLNNAWKFTRSAEPARIEFGQTIQDGTTEYYVRDNGVGFDMQYAKRLFMPFQRMHSSKTFEGTGIGLATVRRIIQRHGGDIRVETQPGHGASFYFTLP